MRERTVKNRIDWMHILFGWLKSILNFLFGHKKGGEMSIEGKSNTKTADLIADKNIQANWNSIFKTMDYWVERKNKEIHYPGSEEVPNQMLILAEEARYFSHKYGSFFSEVEIEPTSADELEQSKLRSQALERVLEEWDTIRHALEQRENHRYQQILTELDELARECISPLFEDEKIRGRIFTYLHKLFDIKRFVFSRTPLIGAPFSAMHSPEDWLAIPHEAGHYIFWNGTETFASFNKFYLTLQNQLYDVIDSAIQNRIQGRPLHHKGGVFQVWLNWLNEIFADVFGTLVAGPAFGWSMQSILRAGLSVGDLLHSHDELNHPDPFIRPFFHINTLRKMAEEKDILPEFARQLKTAADALEASWRGSWPEDIIVKLPTPDSVGSMIDVLNEEVPAIVDIVLDANLGEKLSYTLRQYFRNEVLYNFELHQEVTELAKRIQGGDTVDFASPLKKSIATRLAIVNGMKPTVEEAPAPDERLDQEFEEFIQNVTSSKVKEEQRRAFRRVLNYSLDEQEFHWHTHAHSH